MNSIITVIILHYVIFGLEVFVQYQEHFFWIIEFFIKYENMFTIFDIH